MRYQTVTKEERREEKLHEFCCKLQEVTIEIVEDDDEDRSSSSPASASVLPPAAFDFVKLAKVSEWAGRSHARPGQC